MTGTSQREELDEFAVASQNKACEAVQSGKFKDEIVPIEVKRKKRLLSLTQTRVRVQAQPWKALQDCVQHSSRTAAA